MTVDLEELKSELLMLPAEARAWLARVLMASVGETSVEQADQIVLSTGDSVLGRFRDEPELIDQVVEDALRSREEQPLRLPHG